MKSRMLLSLFTVKKFSLKRIVRIIRLIILYPQIIFLKKELVKQNRPIIVIGTPVHKNLGDHLIAKHELEMLREINPSKTVFEIPTDAYFLLRDKYKRVIPQKSVIVITGGGWMGDMWPEDEGRLQNIIKDHCSKKIIIFPQTIYYQDIENNRNILLNSINTFDSCNDLILFLRDESSFSFAKKYYTNSQIRIYLVPDVGLYRIYDNTIRKKKKIGICLRDDREKITSIDIKKIVRNYSKYHGFSTITFSTICNINVPSWLRDIYLKAIIKKVSEYKLVVTDRLHGMIFCVISGTKCIVLDNKSKKVSGVYNKWLYKNCNIMLIDNDISNEDFYKLFNEILETSNDDNQWIEDLERENTIFKNVVRRLTNES